MASSINSMSQTQICWVNSLTDKKHTNICELADGNTLVSIIQLINPNFDSSAADSRESRFEIIKSFLSATTTLWFDNGWQCRLLTERGQGTGVSERDLIVYTTLLIGVAFTSQRRSYFIERVVDLIPIDLQSNIKLIVESFLDSYDSVNALIKLLNNTYGDTMLFEATLADNSLITEQHTDIDLINTTPQLLNHLVKHCQSSESPLLDVLNSPKFISNVTNRLEKEIDTLKSENVDKIKELKRLKGIIRELEDSYTDHEKELQNKNTCITLKDSENQRLMLKIRNLSDTVDELNCIQDRYTQLDTEHTRLKEKLNKNIKTSNQKGMKEIDDLNEINNSLSSNNKKLSESVKYKDENISHLKGQLDSTSQTMRQIQSTLDLKSSLLIQLELEKCSSEQESTRIIQGLKDQLSDRENDLRDKDIQGENIGLIMSNERLKSLQDEIDDMKSVWINPDRHRSIVDSLSETHANSENELICGRVKISELQASLEIGTVLRSSLDDKINALLEKESSLNTKLKTTQKTCTAVQKELSTNEQAFNSLRTESNKDRQEMDELREENEQLQKRIDSRQNLIDSLVSDLGNKTESLNEITKDANAREQIMKTLGDDLRRAMDELIAERDECLERSFEASQELRKKTEKLTSTEELLKHEILTAGKLTKSCQQLEQKLNQSQRQLSQAEENAMDLTTKIARLETNLKQRDAELSDLERAMDKTSSTQSSEMKQMTNSVQFAEERREKALQMYEDIRESLTSERERRQSLEHKHRDLQSHISLEKERLRELEGTRRTSADDKQSREASLERKCSQLEDQLTKERSQRKLSDQKLVHFEQQLHSEKQRCHLLVDRCKELERARDEERNKCARLREELRLEKVRMAGDRFGGGHTSTDDSERTVDVRGERSPPVPRSSESNPTSSPSTHTASGGGEKTRGRSDTRSLRSSSSTTWSHSSSTLGPDVILPTAGTATDVSEGANGLVVAGTSSAPRQNAPILSQTSLTSAQSEIVSVSLVPAKFTTVGQADDEPDDLEDRYSWDRIAEIQRRNTLCKPHIQSSYPVETHAAKVSTGLNEELLKSGQVVLAPVPVRVPPVHPGVKSRRPLRQQTATDKKRRNDESPPHNNSSGRKVARMMKIFTPKRTMNKKSHKSQNDLRHSSPSSHPPLSNSISTSSVSDENKKSGISIPSVAFNVGFTPKKIGRRVGRLVRGTTTNNKS